MSEAIAIVGFGCRFPGGVNDPESFWQLLREGRDVIRPLSRDGLERFYDARPVTPGRMSTRFGGLLDGLERFDAEFFGISPREAASIDPAQRLLLEASWEAIEDAGVDARKLQDEPVGVFVGQWLSDFENRLFADTDQVDFYATTGSGRYASSGRLSYFLGLSGPSITLDTACSSSLVAIHLACQSLRSGESALAFAAGVNVILQPHIWIAYSQSSMMAPDGRCKFGDAKGDGYVRSEGVGVALLKPLSRALADRDPIRAVIRGSAVNNDGRGSGHLATPSRAGQAQMLRRAYANAGVSPGQVGYVEAHGTGTRAGDPIELGALGDVLKSERAPGARCLVGSVKTNIGHTEGAAGMAGVLKSVLALQHREVPASLHFSEPNPEIPWSELPFEIPRDQTPWPATAEPRLAGVSGFGITGTNAHVVLEEAPLAAPITPRDLAPGPLPLLLSAATPATLRALASAYASSIEAAPAEALGDLCASAALHRTALEHRAVFVAADAATLVEKLRRFSAGDATAADASGRAERDRPRRVAFVFSGQGGQWLGMARELLDHDAAFLAHVERCDAAMPEGRGWSALEQLRLEPEAANYRLNEISVLQPTLLAVEIALAEWWRARGVEPEATVGHSLGEAGAAYLAGSLSLTDAMRVICARSALMQRTSGAGAMALVGLSEAETLARIAPKTDALSIAASNAPRSSVVSGEPAAVAALLGELEAEGVFCRAVKVDVASHSPQMAPLVPELVASLDALRAQAPRLSLYSTVEARRLEPGECDAQYWGRNLRQPVRFLATAERMLADGIDTFIEVGPHPTLLGSLLEVGAASPPLTLASLRRGEPERAALLTALGALWAAGHTLDWTRIFKKDSYQRRALPHYPWQRERHWVSAAAAASIDGAVKRRAPLDASADALLHVLSWEAAPLEPAEPTRKHWLLLEGRPQSADALASALRELGATVDVVSDVTSAASWLSKPKAAELGIAILVEPSDAEPAWRAVATVQQLQRAWPAHAGDPPRLWWVTSHAHPVPGDEQPLASPEQAAVWGAARVIAAEHPTWWGGLADLGAPSTLIEATALAQHLLTGKSEDQVAIRGASRYALRLIQAAPTPSDAPALELRADAAYLLTGGLGGIALEVARALVAMGARRLLLLGRSALPARSSWAKEPTDSAAGRRIAAIRELEHAGAAVHVLHVDVSDRDALARALETYQAEGFPPIRGVIHCAAVMENKLTADMDRAVFERAFAPKLTAALALDQLLPELDFFALFSSMSAFWGPAGLSNYAAANAGLDALSQARRARGQPAISVQWGHWANLGLSEGAIARRNAEELERAGVGAISIEQGRALFSWLLTRPEAVIAVLPVDWRTFRRARKNRDFPLFRLVAGGGEAGGDDQSFRERFEAASPVARRSLIEGVLREALGAVLRAAPKQLDARRSFGSSGLDSLMALEFRNRLETAFERSLPATLAWNYPTIEQLAQHLEGLFSRELEPTPAAVAEAVPLAPAAEAAPLAPSELPAAFYDVAALSDDDAAAALRGGR